MNVFYLNYGLTEIYFVFIWIPVLRLYWDLYVWPTVSPCGYRIGGGYHLVFLAGSFYVYLVSVFWFRSFLLRTTLFKLRQSLAHFWQFADYKATNLIIRRKSGGNDSNSPNQNPSGSRIVYLLLIFLVLAVLLLAAIVYRQLSDIDFLYAEFIKLREVNKISDIVLVDQLKDIPVYTLINDPRFTELFDKNPIIFTQIGKYQYDQILAQLIKDVKKP